MSNQIHIKKKLFYYFTCPHEKFLDLPLFTPLEKNLGAAIECTLIPLNYYPCNTLPLSNGKNLGKYMCILIV